MRRIDLDFLQKRPPVPALAWLLLAFGLASAAFVLSRYRDVSADLASEQARAARVAQARPSGLAVAGGDASLLAAPWHDLFDRLERTRPEGVAFLSLDADGQAGTLLLFAETRNAADMVGYLETLRRDGGFRDVALSGHTAMLADDGSESVQFRVRMGWKP